VTLKDYKSYSEIKVDLANGSISCVQLLDHYVQKISQSKTNAFLEVFHDSALQQALTVDKKIQSKTAGQLAGMVIGIKDNISYKGHKVSGSSKILSGYSSIYNATVIERLLNEDAIIIGRLNCDEFAMGGSNENSAFGNVLNPIQHDKVPGGSSGGSAAAVREGLCIATLGSDTGGSIRQPASFCGIVGFKPTYGSVSRYGLLAYASSFDQIGPLTHTVEDAALITQIMAGIDDYDSTLSTRPVENLVEATHRTPSKKKFAVLKECFHSAGLDSEIKSRMLSIIDELKAEGHIVEEISFPFLDYLVPNYYVLTTAEASSNLSRYDGIHYGYRSPNAVDIESTYLKSRSEGFGPEVKRRIMLGTFVLSAGYFDAYYTKALKVRNLIKQKTEEIFKVFDFMLLPTTPSTAFKIGENTKDPITMYLQDIFTVHANLAGIPAISLPLGNHSNGLPFGVQLMSKRFSDAELLELSNHLMKRFAM
jgi:aspartyl-tRNA(Asn)/glutamyl-tRNA(Gln) amidotransferase subunit A